MEEEYTFCAECRLKNSRMFMPKESGVCDLLIINDHPTNIDCKVGYYASNESRVVLNAIREISIPYKIGFDFSIGCVSECALKADDIYRCASRIKKRIQEAKPKVIIAMGTNAARSLGFKKPIKQLRGTTEEIKIDGSWYKVVFTYAPEAIYKKPGLSQLLTTDLKKARDLCEGSPETNDFTIQIPQTYKEVAQALDNALKAANNSQDPLLMAVDTETSSLDAHNRDEKIIAVSLSWGVNQGTAFLLDHRDANYTDQEIQDILARLEKLLQSDKVYACYANAKFDYKWLHHNYGLDILFPKVDIILAEHTISEDKTGEYGLKLLTRDYFPQHSGYDAELDKALEDANEDLKKQHKKVTEQALEAFLEGWQALSDEQRRGTLETWVGQGFIPITDIEKFCNLKTVKKRGERILNKSYVKGLMVAVKKVPGEVSGISYPEPGKATFEDVPTDTLLWYAAMDAMMTRKVFVKQHQIMTTSKFLTKRPDTVFSLYGGFLKHTMPLCPKIAEMEYNGIRLDREKARQHMETTDQYLAELKEALYSVVGRPFNMSPSAKDLENILFKDMGFKPVKYTDMGRPSTDKESLKALYTKHDDLFLKNLVTYREIEKVRNTYFKNWIEDSAYDGRVHFSLSQHGTTTYRLSCNKGLQNAPGRLDGANIGVKDLFIPDSEDMELYDMDIANAEMRVLCAYSGDQALIDAFNNDKDFHSLTAAGISDFSYEQILAKKEDKTSDEHRLRQLGKKINFGTVYSMGPKRLKEQLWTENRIEISEKKAKEYLDKFFETYPGVGEYIKHTQAFAARYKYVYTYTGRIRRFPLIGNSRYQQSRAFRQAVNARIQTTSADIVNTNLIDISDAIKPLGGRVILTVHDSVLFQLPKDTSGVKDLLDRVIVENTREKFPWLPVKWKYDVGRGPNYGECKYDLI